MSDRSSSADAEVDTVADDDPVIGPESNAVNKDDASESSGVDAEEYDESETALVDEDMDISAVRASRTAAKQAESAGEFLLTRQAVVRFVQDSIAESVDRQKRNADKN